MSDDDRGQPSTDRSGPRGPIPAVVPGTEELLRIAMQVNGTKDSITTIATRWRTTAGDMNDHAIELTRAVNAVDHAWQGDSAEAFDDYMRKYGKAGDALHLALADCAASLDTAANTLDTAETKVNSLTSNLVTQWNNSVTVNNGRADKDKKTQAQLAADIKPAVDQALTEARTQLNDADKAVGQAATDLKKYMDERSITFKDIPAAGDEKFVPAPGRTLDWQKTPLADPERTRLAGGSGGSGGYGSGGSGSGGSGSGGSGSGGDVSGVIGSGGTSSGGTVPQPKEKVVGWIKEALTIIKSGKIDDFLKKKGLLEKVKDLDPNDPQDIQRIWTIIFHESGGNPNAQNNWDVNARNGVPSQGLMQTIPPTFAAWSPPGHKVIKDPIDNIIAGVLYTYGEYGSLAQHRGIKSLENGGDYLPY
ncbi:WXG100 family type VII secretion target [Streptosporangium sp. CA-135522]|uniref:WXG100 family type VII secretion target n=1 Tax=Streptosporangium sp. CA-135522 TaxID=3240072 RepID=UPI003D8D95F8